MMSRQEGGFMIAAAAGQSQGVQAIAKALDLLCSFSSDHPEWGVTEIAEYLGMCKSAAHRILATCEAYNFVERTASRRYRLGIRALELGNVCRFDRGMVRRAEPVMRALAEECGGIAHLGELDGREVLELSRSAAPGVRIFTTSPCFRAPAHATGMGKVLLAFGGEGNFRGFIGLQRRLKRYTPNTITSPEVLKRELAQVVEQGYAVSDQESTLGCRCVAVPVRKNPRAVVAALSISGALEQFSDHVIPKLALRLMQAADRIGREEQAGVARGA
jgi:DNA-binding IclR family transcriptional regulator